MRRFVVLSLLVVAVVVGCRRAEEATTESSATVVSTAKEPSRGEEKTVADIGGSVGQRIPPYAAKRLDGSPFALADERDKVVLLNVWATWCGPCRFEIPELQGLHNKYAARGFEVIGASVDEGDPQIVKDFAAEQKMTYPIVLDPEGKIAGLLDASVLPTTVLIDRNGRIVWKKIGVVEPRDAELMKAIEKAL